MNLTGKLLRLKVAVCGAVQGVGFRPFVYRLAVDLGLKGRVQNSGEGVLIEAEGPRASLERFLARISEERPPHSRITSLESTWLDPAQLGAFQIVESKPSGPKRALVLPDIATCHECRAEIFDPANRRYLYPFTNCVYCGPRFSIIEALPYDRANTSMKAFEMCPACRREYEDPANRRFHAQPNACPICGPHIEVWDDHGHVLAGAAGAGFEVTLRVLQFAVDAVRAGQVLALKGLGGFHLVVDARNAEAVERLRQRKHREEKPFALMVPSIDLLRHYCAISPAEERLLCGPESPIVIASRAEGAHDLASGVAPGNPTLGVMLPYTPLHHLLMRMLGRPIVATSGNLSDEPICTHEQEAVERLAGIADLFLVHNRPIVRHVDDSIVRIAVGREMVLRRARGYAPLPVPLKEAPVCGAVLATGAHLKNTVACSVGSMAFISQHIGDLETAAAFEAFERASTDLPRLYETAPAVIAADAHPDYLSTRYAREISAARGLQLVQVQHHVAHVLSCMAENEIEPPVLGVAWDGTGFGLDGTVWGGEFFEVTASECKRVAHFRRFRLPGGEAAVKEPRRSAAGLLFEIFGEEFASREDLAHRLKFDHSEFALVAQMLMRGVNSPQTSSAGRLFDAVSALVGLRQITRHEGQAAMELEFAADLEADSTSYPAPILREGEVHILDWEPMIRAILQDVRCHRPVSHIAAGFHRTLREWIVTLAARINHPRVVLSGGCFQNVRLLEMTVARLEQAGFQPVWHQRVPPNDGGIALGQIAAAARERA